MLFSSPELSSDSGLKISIFRKKIWHVACSILQPCMDPITCPMCQGAIPGSEIGMTTVCGSCGADLSQLVKQRIAQLQPKAPAPTSASSFPSQAALFSLIAPCFSIVVNFLGHQAVRDNDFGKLVLGSVCGLFIVAGFVLGIIALFNAAKGEGQGKAIAGISINGILIGFAILNLLAYQRMAAQEKAIPDQRPKGWSYMSGR